MEENMEEMLKERIEARKVTLKELTERLERIFQTIEELGIDISYEDDEVEKEDFEE